MEATMQHQLGPATLTEFVGQMAGAVVLPTDGEYDAAREVWNAAHDLRPQLVVRCRRRSDVVDTVNFARSEGLLLAVRGGGHSVAGFSTCDGGLVLDTGPMTGVRVDPATSRAHVQGGCLWRDVDAATQRFGLAVTGGLVSSTGVAGFTLGGGIGWLARKVGLSADNLLSADIVTADGRTLHVSPSEHPDLFWALTGGGGNFGVVTCFELALHRIGTSVYAGMVLYPADEAEEVVTRYGQACQSSDDAMTTVLKVTTVPATAAFPTGLHGRRVVVVVGCWAGDPVAAVEGTTRFRSLGTVLADTFAERDYTQWQQALDPSFPRGQHNYFQAVFVDALGAEEAAVLKRTSATLPNGLTEVVVHQLGGAVARVSPEATAFATRDATHIVNVIARTRTTAGFNGVRTWAREVTQALRPGGATYVNFAGEPGADLMRRSYPEPTYRRLVAVKDRYDPTNLFRLNQNIPPSTHSEVQAPTGAAPSLDTIRTT
jgi:FAD/FMN-containing dehydrogenase